MNEQEISNRFDHHPATDTHTAGLHEKVRTGCKDLARIFDQVTLDCREKSLAITRLEEAMFWANAAVARNVRWRDEPSI